jgi:hypothetical protein
MDKQSKAVRFEVRVKHRTRVAPRYTWEIHAENKAIPVQESPGFFNSWNEASQAGQDALGHFLKG